MMRRDQAALQTVPVLAGMSAEGRVWLAKASEARQAEEEVVPLEFSSTPYPQDNYLFFARHLATDR